jgi:uncharacterized membrane protein YdjX (TVP38/TMEM64 family)
MARINHTHSQLLSRASEKGREAPVSSSLVAYRTDFMTDHLDTSKSAKGGAGALKQWLPLAVLILLMVAAYVFRLHDYLSFGQIVENRSTLDKFVNERIFLAVAIYMLIYVAVVALSLPGAAILSVFGGFLFGWYLSVPLTVISATLGAAIVFQVVKTSLGKAIAERAGPFVNKLSKGFADDAAGYLLFLRLAPVFPFFAVNAVAGICRVDFKTFLWTTFVGIIPGSIAFAWLGKGLDSIIKAEQAAHTECVARSSAENCPYTFSVSSLLTTEILIAFAALGVVALIPVALKKWKARHV